MENFTLITTVDTDITAENMEAQKKLGLDIAALFLYFTNLVLHSLGSYLLVRLYRRGKDDVEQVYLIHLSITDALINLLSIIQTPLLVEELPLSDEMVSVLADMQYHVGVVLGTGLTLINYVTVMYITVDKLLEILLNIRYPLYWSLQRAKYLILATWVSGIVICVIFSLREWDHCSTHSSHREEITHEHAVSDGENVTHGEEEDTNSTTTTVKRTTFQDIFPIYVYPTFDFIFICIAVTTYVFIFKVFMKKQREEIKSSNQRRKERQNVIKIFLKSRFYVSALLIASFVLFVVLPDFLWLFMDIIYAQHSYDLVVACNMCYSIWYLSNAFIYIYLKTNVKRLFWKKVYHTFPFLNRRRNAIHTTETLVSRTQRTERVAECVGSTSEAGSSVARIYSK